MKTRKFALKNSSALTLVTQSSCLKRGGITVFEEILRTAY